MNNLSGHFSHIFFDADDTLWENEFYFRAAEDEFVTLMSKYVGSDLAAQTLALKQEENIPLFGYGSKTYMLGMLDAAAELCPNDFDKSLYFKIKQIIYNLAYHPMRLIDGVEETIETLSGKYELIIATKGDLTEQLTKFHQSGLEKYFRCMEVLRSKDEKDYTVMARKYGVNPSQMLMIGNSVKSDIVPVINIGGTAIHIPHEIVWVHEMMEMPHSNRIIEVKNIKSLLEYLL